MNGHLSQPFHRIARIPHRIILLVTREPRLTIAAVEVRDLVRALLNMFTGATQRATHKMHIRLGWYLEVVGAEYISVSCDTPVDSLRDVRFQPDHDGTFILLIASPA